MKYVLLILFLLKVLPEEPTIWGGTWSPLQGITELLAWHGLKIPLVDMCFLLVFLVWRFRSPRARTREMSKAMLASVGGIALCAVWGLARGGSAYQVQFQVYSYVFSFIAAIALAKLLVTPEDFLWFGKYLWLASIYRACTCITKYVSVVNSTGLPPFVATTHEDSVLFVLGIVMAIAFMLEMRGRLRFRTRFSLIVGIVLLVLAIQFNNRRLAWVSLVASLILMYFFMPPSALKKKINRRLLQISPILILYVAVGTGRPEKIFAPLKALSSVKSEDDPSTRSRDVENLGLLVTLAPNTILGTGWGVEYTEIDSSYSQAFKHAFEQYRYLPHNSFLGFVAFTGMLGFALIWVVFPTAVFLNARAYLGARSPPVRVVTMVSVCIAITVANQGWGDLGLFAQIPMAIAGLAFASAIRMPSASRESHMAHASLAANGGRR